LAKMLLPDDRSTRQPRGPMFPLLRNCRGRASVEAIARVVRPGQGHGPPRAPNVVTFICVLLLATWASCSIAATREQPKRVLMIGAYSEMLPSTVAASTAIRKRLKETSPEVEVFFNSLDLGRFPGKAHEELMARFLAEKYTANRPDVIVALGAAALRYLLQNRDTIMSNVPIVFCCVASAGPFSFLPNVTGAFSDYDWSKTLTLAASLQPTARDVVVISGASEHDRYWHEDARRDLEESIHSYNVRHLEGLPYEALLKEVARLPRETIVLLSPMFMDGGGSPRVPTDVAADIVKVSNAPVYAPIETFLGLGVVGGYMDTFENAGAAAADLVVEILRGNSKSIPPPISTPHSYRVDARQLQRWGFSERHLPAGTVVLFKEPTLWEQHRNLVLATIGAFVLLTAILAVLSVQMIRRRRAEASVKQSEERMAFAAASSNTGLWQYDVATRQLWATDHCRSMFGLGAGPLAPARFMRAVHPDDRRLAAAAARSAIHGGQTVDEFRVVHGNGQTRWLSASGQSEFDQNGKPVRVSGVVMDITKRKMAEYEARQLSQRLSTVQDEERQQIAQELHDSTMQHLAAMGLNMMSLKARAASDAKMRMLCEDIEGSLDEASRELRTFTYLLQPPELELDGLRSTLRRFVEGFATRTGHKITLNISRIGDELPLAVQRSLLRVVQEALANVHRHASASHVSVTLKRTADQIHLVVSDDGKGMEGLATHKFGIAPKKGVGLTSMTTRLRQLGGELAIRTDAKGTTLHGVIPVRVTDAEYAGTHDEPITKH
jgi:PAS domain S-box-containing protein